MLIAPGFMSMLKCRGTAPPPSRIGTIRALMLCQNFWNYQLEFGGSFTSTSSLSCTTINSQKFNVMASVWKSLQWFKSFDAEKNHISWQERMDFTPGFVMPSIPGHSRLRQRGCSSSIAPDPLHRY